MLAWEIARQWQSKNCMTPFEELLGAHLSCGLVHSTKDCFLLAQEVIWDPELKAIVERRESRASNASSQMHGSSLSQPRELRFQVSGLILLRFANSFASLPILTSSSSGVVSLNADPTISTPTSGTTSPGGSTYPLLLSAPLRLCAIICSPHLLSPIS